MTFPTFTEWLKQRFPYNIYAETVEHLPNTSFLINEMPHVSIKEAPPELDFLCGFVDFGLENSEYKLSVPNIAKAIYGNGVAIPNETYKIRLHSMFLILEPSTGEEPLFPEDWKQCLCVMNNDSQFTYIGKKVRPDQIGNIDYSQYEDIGDAWIILK